MPLKSLGLASDVMVLGNGSNLEEHPDRFILRSPDEPDFWFGNMIMLRDDVVDSATQIARFQTDFPHAGHVTITWDVLGMRMDDRFDGFKSLGFEVEQDDVLVLDTALTPFAPPQGITLRPLTSDEDWAKATELQGITGLDRGHSAEGYLPYIKTRMETCRRLTEEGLGVWFGAFDGDTLAGDLGIYANARTARFQAVETAKDYRRRGICASLVTAGANWALERHPDTQPVIVAERDGAAGRVYRRCGFALKEELIAAFKGPSPRNNEQD